MRFCSRKFMSFLQKGDTKNVEISIKKQDPYGSCKIMVRMKGFEPSRCYSHGPEPCASANSATSAYFRSTRQIIQQNNPIGKKNFSKLFTISLFLPKKYKMGNLVFYTRTGQPPLHSHVLFFVTVIYHISKQIGTKQCIFDTTSIQLSIIFVTTMYHLSIIF